MPDLVELRESVRMTIDDLVDAHYSEAIEEWQGLLWECPLLDSDQLDELSNESSMDELLDYQFSISVPFAVTDTNQPIWHKCLTDHPASFDTDATTYLSSWRNGIHTFIRVTDNDGIRLSAEDIFSGELLTLTDEILAKTSEVGDVLGVMLIPQGGGDYCVEPILVIALSEDEASLITSLLAEEKEVVGEDPKEIQLFLARNPMFFFWLGMAIAYARMTQFASEQN